MNKINLIENKKTYDVMETFIKDIKVKLKQENPKPKENNNLVPPKPNNPQNNSSPKIDLNLIPPKPNNQPSMEKIMKIRKNKNLQRLKYLMI